MYYGNHDMKIQQLDHPYREVSLYCMIINFLQTSAVIGRSAILVSSFTHVWNRMEGRLVGPISMAGH